jgi:hypothetical protein
MRLYCEKVFDIRMIDRRPLASVGSLVLGLRCSWCHGSAPMPKGHRVARFGAGRVREDRAGVFLHHSRVADVDYKDSADLAPLIHAKVAPVGTFRPSRGFLAAFQEKTYDHESR